MKENDIIVFKMYYTDRKGRQYEQDKFRVMQIREGTKVMGHDTIDF